jgi:hypothetical protein
VLSPSFKDDPDDLLPPIPDLIPEKLKIFGNALLDEALALATPIATSRGELDDRMGPGHRPQTSSIGDYLETDIRMQNLLDNEGGLTLGEPCSSTKAKTALGESYRLFLFASTPFLC